VLGRGLGLLLELDAGLFGTWPPAPGAPVFPWLPDAPLMLPLLVGFGDLLPGAAFVPPGMPTPGVALDIGEAIDPPLVPEPMLPDVDIGRGAIVIEGVIAPPLDDPVPIEPWLVEPPIDPWPIEPPMVPILPPARAAVARQTYFPPPLPYCAEPFA
jgi:hypothetical protein